MRFRDEWAAARIDSIDDVSPTIRLFEIDAGEQYRCWTPGSHIRVGVMVDGQHEVRTYSLVQTGADDRKYRIAVKFIGDGLGGSRYMWSLQAGTSLTISQPQNHFDLSLHARAYTLVAGGVGITPMIGMAHALRASDKPVRLIYGVRSRREAAFADLLRACLGDRLDLRVTEETGPLDMAAIVRNVPAGGELYICGPIAMLEAARNAWMQQGRPAGLLRYETFAASGHYPTQAFTAVLPRFNMELEVHSHQSLLSAMEQAGLEIMSDCLRGECGLCTVAILECDAPIDHRDVFFSDKQKAENRKLCACVSRPAGGRIRIDTDYRHPRLSA
jgi:vanillate O-demethylase ferredoxin subunit